MGAGPDNEPLASPGNFFPGRKRRVAELFAELLGRSFLPFPHFAAVDHYIVGIALSLDLDLAKFLRDGQGLVQQEPATTAWFGHSTWPNHLRHLRRISG